MRNNKVTKKTKVSKVKSKTMVKKTKKKDNKVKGFKRGYEVKIVNKVFDFGSHRHEFFAGALPGSSSIICLYAGVRRRWLRARSASPWQPVSGAISSLWQHLEAGRVCYLRITAFFIVSAFVFQFSCTQEAGFSVASSVVPTMSIFEGNVK